MTTSSKNGFMITLLTSSNWRLFRHLVLLSFTLSIAAGFIWGMQEEGQVISTIGKYGGVFLLTLLFLGGSYLNIYALTPGLLLKGKWAIYFLSLLGVVLAILGFAILTQSFYTKGYGSIAAADYLLVVANLFSSTLGLFLLFAGTTTLVLFKNWIQDMQQSEELETATLQMELKLLENQINPHFLFNMLNNANIMIKKDPDVASHIVGKLEDMLRYQINDSSREKVLLKEEILFLNGFLGLEKTRRDYFTYTIAKEGNIDNIQIPPLLFITFVENAVKHSQDSQRASYVHILFKQAENQLIFTCENSLPSKTIDKQTGGLGLINIKRRLELLYKDDYSLKKTKTDTSYSVKLGLKL